MSEVGDSSSNIVDSRKHMDLLFSKAKDKILDAEDITVFTHTDQLLEIIARQQQPLLIDIGEIRRIRSEVCLLDEIARQGRIIAQAIDRDHRL